MGGGGSGGGAGGGGGGKPEKIKCPNCGSENVEIGGVIAVYEDPETGERKMRVKIKCKEPTEKCNGPDQHLPPIPAGAIIVGDATSPDEIQGD